VTARDRIDAVVVIAKAVMRMPVGLGSDDTAQAIAVALEAEGLLVNQAKPNVQVIPAGSLVRRMRAVSFNGTPYRVAPVDLPDGGSTELWVDPLVAPVLAAQLANTSVELSADMGDYRKFAAGEVTGMQEAGMECVRCGRYVEDTAVAVRLVGFTEDLNSTVVACHPRCGSSPWDAEQLGYLLEMPDPPDVDGSPGDLFDPTDPAGGE